MKNKPFIISVCLTLTPEQIAINLKLPDNSKPFNKKLQVDRNVHIEPDGLGTGNLFNERR